MKRTKKFVAVVLCAISMLFLLSACVSEESSYTTELKSNIFEKYGLPDVENFFEYSQLKEIYEMRDNPDLICYWYTKNDYTGKWIYQGTCIGYGIPYGAAITAPSSFQKISGMNWDIAPQAEPNGLYTESVVTTATWILGTDENGDIKPIYTESEIMVSQFKIEARLCEDWSVPADY